jgi:hypothetical protein
MLLLLLQSALAVGVVFHVVLPWVFHQVLRALFSSSAWYAKLGDEQIKIARRLSCILHHSLVASGALYCLRLGEANGGEALFRSAIILLEAGMS